MALKSDYSVKLVNGGTDTSVTIASGQTVSTVLDCAGTSLLAIKFPSNLTNGTITFQSGDSLTGPFYNLSDFQGDAFAINAVASNQTPLDPATFSGVEFLQITSSVAQTNAVTLKLVLGPIFS